MNLQSVVTALEPVWRYVFGIGGEIDPERQCGA